MKNKKRFWSNLGFMLLSLALVLFVAFFDLSLINGSRKSSPEDQLVQVNPSEQEQALPAVSSSDWELVLVNRDNPTDMAPASLAKVEDIELDSRIEEATKQFLAAIRQIEPEQTLISGYRSKEAQTELYNEYVAKAEEAGLSHGEAENQVRKQVQLPGASEHQTGLALDISVPTGQSDELAEQIAALAPRYGFILRYPKNKSQITGVDFENWHYRYVGVESATYIVENNLVLEEYITLLKEAGR